MALGAENGRGLKAAFHDIRELKVDVAYPFLLEVISRLRRATFWQGRVTSGGPAGGKLRVPTGRVRHPHEFDEQDVRDVCAGAEEGPLPREHPGPLPAAAVVPPVSRDEEFKREIQRKDSLQLSQPKSTGCGGWKTTTGKSACRSMNTRLNTFCRRTRTSRMHWKTELGPEWERNSEDLPHTRESDADRLQPGIQRPTVYREEAR